MAEVIGLFNGISGRVGNVIYVRRGGKHLSRNYRAKEQLHILKLRKKVSTAEIGNFP